LIQDQGTGVRVSLCQIEKFFDWLGAEVSWIDNVHYKVAFFDGRHGLRDFFLSE
jgi:hypothetical protein